MTKVFYKLIEFFTNSTVISNFSILALGLAVYVIHDLPRAIPHNVGKKLFLQLKEKNFSKLQSERISFETRKVMRLAGWDLRERFRFSLESSEFKKRSIENNLKNSDFALNFLENYLKKLDDNLHKVNSVEL